VSASLLAAVVGEIMTEAGATRVVDLLGIGALARGLVELVGCAEMVVVVWAKRVMEALDTSLVREVATATTFGDPEEDGATYGTMVVLSKKLVPMVPGVMGERVVAALAYQGTCQISGIALGIHPKLRKTGKVRTNPPMDRLVISC
jgi:hypothetical protein